MQPGVLTAVRQRDAVRTGALLTAVVLTDWWPSPITRKRMARAMPKKCRCRDPCGGCGLAVPPRG